MNRLVYMMHPKVVNSMNFPVHLRFSDISFWVNAQKLLDWMKIDWMNEYDEAKMICDFSHTQHFFSSYFWCVDAIVWYFFRVFAKIYQFPLVSLIWRKKAHKHKERYNIFNFCFCLYWLILGFHCTHFIN